MTFLSELIEHEAKATDAPWNVEHETLVSTIREEQRGFTHMPSAVAESYHESHEANCELIAFLRNHAQEIINLVGAAEDLEAVVNPESDREKAAWWKLKVALAALNKEQS